MIKEAKEEDDEDTKADPSLIEYMFWALEDIPFADPS